MSNTKHGLFDGSLVLPNEDQREFDELICEYHLTFAPANAHECFLVEEMVQSRWRLARIRRLEGVMIGKMLDAAGSSDADAVLAAALLGNTAGPFKTLQSYAAAAERSYYRALKQLQAGRKQQEAQAAETPAVQDEPNLAANDSDSTPAASPKAGRSIQPASAPSDPACRS